jgi:hypothetical protein
MILSQFQEKFKCVTWRANFLIRGGIERVALSQDRSGTKKKSLSKMNIEDFSNLMLWLLELKYVDILKHG